MANRSNVKICTSEEETDLDLYHLLDSDGGAAPFSMSDNEENKLDSPKSTDLKPILKTRSDSIYSRKPSVTSHTEALDNACDALDKSLSSLGTPSVALSISMSGSGKTLRRNSSVVSFKSVEIREYDRTLGDNPSCMSGPPISLDWSYSNEHEICLEDYEKVKESRCRKYRHAPRLLKAARIDTLYQLGYTEDEIKFATKEKREIQRSRSMTNLISPFWRLEDAAESVNRKVKRSLRRLKSETSLNPLDISNSSSTGRAASVFPEPEPTLEI